MGSGNAVTYERHGDSFAIVWPESHVGFGIDRLRETHWGDLYGFLTVDTVSAEAKGTLYGPIKIGLEDYRSQEGIAEVLHKRVKLFETSDAWLTLLATACARISRDWRKPTPTVDLSTMVDDGQNGQVPYLFKGLIPLGETTILFGDGESGKSLIALMLAVCHSLGLPTPWENQPPAIGKVLYLDWETNARTLRSRLRRVCQGMGCSIPAIGYRNCQKSLVDELPSIREEISREKYTAVVVDSIGFAMTGSLTEDSTARESLSALRAMDPVTRLVVAHVNGDTARNPNIQGRPFGSVFFWNGMRSGIEVRRAKDEATDGEIDLGLYHRKHNDGWAHPVIALKVCFDGLAGPIAFDPQTLADIPDLVSGTALSTRIRQLLKQGKMDSEEIAEALGVPKGDVSATAQRMRDVIKLNPGKKEEAEWGLLVPGKLA